jgi:hypothetical protein
VKAGSLTSGYFSEYLRRTFTINKQMTVKNTMYTAVIGANNNWNSMDWKSNILLVRKLQMRIAKWVK